MKKGKCILSLTTSGHGVGCVVALEGKIVAANTLERLTRKKNDILIPLSRVDLKEFGWNSAPAVYEQHLDLPFDFVKDYTNIDFEEYESFNDLIDHVINAAGLELADVDTVVYSYRHVESARRFFANRIPGVEFLVPEHHFSHACQAFLPSPFDEAAILVVDGQGVPMARTCGDQLSGCVGYGRGDQIAIFNEFPVQYSLGGMYAAFTKKAGFKTNEECKLMGLASYGTDTYFRQIESLIDFDIREFGFRNIAALLRQGFKRRESLYRIRNFHPFLKTFLTRDKNMGCTQIYQDLAYAGQKMVEKVMVGVAERLQKKTGSKNLCIAGGVGLNCVANYQVLINTGFENIFVYPNTGDNGLAAGQALYAYVIHYGNKRNYVCTNDYLGKSYSNQEIRQAVDSYKTDSSLTIKEFKGLPPLYEEMAEAIANGKITSWWQGRSEFGPRALGNRSILADPRKKEMKDILNSRVKFRESFRPFTPSVLRERARKYFELDIESPFMLLAPFVKPDMADVVPSITHVDNTARVQTVSRGTNERFYDLIQTFEKKTGVGVVLNTSFNVAGEPIVETPKDALKCFSSTDIDVLGIDHFLIRKKKYNPNRNPH
jgi:carbamoyltransferase